MNTVDKPKNTQQKTTVSDSLLPKAVKQVMKQNQKPHHKPASVSGSLSRLLDANSDCV